jgi:hypothetical protein
LKYFKTAQTELKPKPTLPCPQKFELKYGWRSFEVRNNFTYKGFLRSEMDFEIKFGEVSMG